MRVKKLICTVLACAMFVSCLCINAGAIECTPQEEVISIARATGRFSTDVPGGATFQASTSFPLEAGESITIKASYTPFSASVDFGLIAPDGLLYSINVTSGSIDQAIVVNRRGNYTFAIRNNSSVPISVSGYVNY